MKLKLDESGSVIVADGKPVYVDDAGKDHSYDAPAMRTTLNTLGRELQTQRESNEKLTNAAKAFEGLDPEAARKAVELAANLNSSKLVDAGKIEEIKAAAIRSVEEKYKPVSADRDRLQRELYDAKVGAEFGRTKVLETTILTARLAQSEFGRNFEIKDGHIIAKDGAGNLIYSDTNPGSPAGFDEALQKLITAHPDSKDLLKGSGHNGSGANGVDGAGGGRQVTRAQFAALSPEARVKTAAAARSGAVELID